ncbi:MAG: TolC family protein [Desulfocapsaceae bacterium]|jgi:outer membrane protein TolC|nr:TolC family protein [Desulfocapsaceae bacterium]
MMIRFSALTLFAAAIVLVPAQMPCHAAADIAPLEISLAKTVRTALENNLGLKLRKQDVEISEGVLLEAESTFDALLSADIAATETSNAPITFEDSGDERSAAWNASVRKRFSPGTEFDVSWQNGNLDTDSDIYLFDPIYNTGVTFGVTQPLLRGRGEKVQTAEIKSAQSGLQANSFLVDSEAADLAAETKVAYWQLVYAYQNLEVLKLGLTLAKTLYDDTAAKIRAGKLASIDIYQPESEVARREEDLITGERAIGVAESNLKLLMNSQDWSTPLSPTSEPETAPITPEIAIVFENALENRPDLKAAAMQIRATEFQLDKAQNDILPALNLFGSVGLSGTDDTYTNALDSSLADSETEWQVGITISRPFSNSLAKGRLRKAQAENRKSRTSLELLRQNIRRTVQITVRDIELALKAIEATRKTAIATEKRLEAEQIKFDAGRATTLDVLIAQQDYSSALSAENRATVIYAQTLAELDRIQGFISIND